MKLLVTSPWPPHEIERARAAFPQVEFVSADTPEAQAAAIADADAVFGHVTAEAFAQAKQLRWIQSQSAGVEWTAHVPALQHSDVAVCNTRGAHGPTIAEHTFGMLIMLTRGLVPLLDAQRAHRWERMFEVPLRGLTGMTMGIVGLGNIGRAIAERAHAFGMAVVAVDVNDVPPLPHVSELGRLDKLPDLLRRSDAVVVTVPITAETRGMLGAAELALMKPDAYLLVISRGGLIDEAALVKMLREGKLAGAGLDVQATEPLPEDSEVWDAPNLILTPHCSAVSDHTLRTATDIFMANLNRFLAGEPVQNTVDVRRGY